jgi:IstB-like ATP binding protein
MTVKPTQPRKTGSPATSRDLTAEVTFLTRALKAPTLRDAVPRLAERARAESWSHEEFLVACLQREVSARESHGGEGRIRAARFPARKSIEEFDFDHARGLIGEVSRVRLGRMPGRGFSVVSGDGLVAEPMRRPVLVLPPSTRRGPGPALGACPTEGRTMRNRRGPRHRGVNHFTPREASDEVCRVRLGQSGT